MDDFLLVFGHDKRSGLGIHAHGYGSN